MITLAEQVDELPRYCGLSDAEFSRAFGLVGGATVFYRYPTGSKIVVFPLPTPDERIRGLPPFVFDGDQRIEVVPPLEPSDHDPNP